MFRWREDKTNWQHLQVYLGGRYWPIYLETPWPSQKVECIVCGRIEYSDSMSSWRRWTDSGTQCRIYMCRGMACNKLRADEAFQKYAEAEVVSYVKSRLGVR